MTRAISRSVVSLLKEYVGRGPTKTRTYVHSDSVLVLMYGGHTTGEETLGEGGRKEAVAHQRVRMSDVIRDQLTAVIEAETGRKVVGCMSSSQQDPSLFLLRLRLRLDRPDVGLGEQTTAAVCIAAQGVQRSKRPVNKIGRTQARTRVTSRSRRSSGCHINY